MRKGHNRYLFIILPLLISVAFDAALTIGARQADAAGCPTYLICPPDSKQSPPPGNTSSTKKKNQQAGPSKKR
jgi:hypothetical protein